MNFRNFQNLRMRDGCMFATRSITTRVIETQKKKRKFCIKLLYDILNYTLMCDIKGLYEIMYFFIFNFIFYYIYIYIEILWYYVLELTCA